MTKILDIPQSINAANGNITLAKDLFTMFLSDLNLRFEQIKDSFSSNNTELLTEHIHKLYGATAYCIVPELRKNVGILEVKLKEKDYSHLDKLVESVLQEMQALIKDGPNFIKEDWTELENQ